jgi:dihydroorotate dehydrogenase
MSRPAGLDFYPLLRPFLFGLDAEAAHRSTLDALRWLGARRAGRAIVRSLAGRPLSGGEVDCLGLRFANRLGLAAGYDKDAAALRGLACLGFGHVEVGTVTPRPQAGSARPRLFRLEQDQALVNRLGFPSRGAAHVARALLENRPPGVVVGVNLGKNAETPLEAAAEDYLELVETFGPLADYLAINVSSPNTPGLRRLQGRTHLEELLTLVRGRLASTPGRRPPLLVKLAPDLSPQELEEAVGACLGRADGVIAVNTTVARPGLRSRSGVEHGGLSGRPLFPRALDAVQRIACWSGGRLAIVGCGGISSPEDVRAMLDAGAQLVQVYTALVYQGPRLVRRLLESP